MNYRHVFHAGNFADVFKHVLLVRLLQGLQNKDKGFVCIETHAGAGRYDLKSSQALKTSEHLDGIGRLWDSAPSGAEDYLAAVRAVNRGAALRFYPGSPRIARFFLRRQDRLRLCEQAPDDCRRLHAEFAGDSQVQVRCGDGFAALKSWLPPPERRGLVLIDPPYEHDAEWERVQAALLMALDRWATGIYAVWYPLKADGRADRFKAGIVASGLRRVLLAEFLVAPSDTPFRLSGSGMLLINPPWQLDTVLQGSLPALADRLRQSHASPQVRIEWLVPE